MYILYVHVYPSPEITCHLKNSLDMIPSFIVGKNLDIWDNSLYIRCSVRQYEWHSM